jgi:hypothetical protein
MDNSKKSQKTNEHIDIASIGSPSSTTSLSLDVLESAVKTKLVGELGCFKFIQDDKTHYALGQITEVYLRNTWLEDPTIKSLARLRGSVPPVSGNQDIHQGKMNLGAVFRVETNGYSAGVMGTVPPTGTPIKLVDNPLLDKLLSRNKSELFYPGRMYNSGLRFPTWFKHFGTDASGAGEAYHIGIFGKTGSGKSVLARMLLLAYARHDDMAILVMDPQGEFCMDIQGELEGSRKKTGLLNILKKKYKRTVNIIDINKLALDSWSLFEKIILKTDFFRMFSISEEKAQSTAKVIVSLFEDKKIKISDIYKFECFEIVMDFLQDPEELIIVYSGKAERDRIAKQARKLNSDKIYNKYWLPICNLFRVTKQTIPVSKIIPSVLKPDKKKPVLFIDVSERNVTDRYWNDSIQSLVIKTLLERIETEANKAFKSGRSLNTLVMIDEAHKFAPSEKNELNEELAEVRERLVNAVRTTRKYGLGWLFISQSLSSLHKDIIAQMRMLFFGFGLGFGSEYNALLNIAGGNSESLNLYKTLRDPHSSFDKKSRRYSFMTFGPVTPLSFAGTPLFFDAYDYPEEFARENGLE